MKKNPIKASIWYTVGNYFLKGIGLITIPLFSRLLSVEDYGIYNTFIAYESFLYLFIELALHECLRKAKYKYDDLNPFSANILLIPIFFVVFYEILSVPFSASLAKIANLPQSVIPILIWYSFCSGVITYYRALIALDYNYNSYLKISLFNVICNVFLSIALMLTCFSNRKFMGRIVGGVIAYSIVALYAIVLIFKNSKPKVDWNHYKFALKYSLPIIPHGLAQIVLLQFDRIMINSLVGSTEAGIYGFSYTVFTMVQILSQSLDSVYEPWVFEQFNNQNHKKIKTINNSYCILLCLMIGLCIIFSPEIIYILGGKKYSESIKCIIPVLLGGFFSMLYSMPAQIEYYYEKTAYISIGTTLAALLNVVLNWICIPKFGYVAAAYTTLVTYFLYFFIHLILAYKLSGYATINIKILGICAGTLILLCVCLATLYSYFVLRLVIYSIFLVATAYILVKQLFGDSQKLILMIKQHNTKL